MGSDDRSSDGDTLLEGQGQNSNVQIDTDEKIQNEETKKETMGSDARSSDGDTSTERQGQNSNEAETAENVKRQQKETMGSDDRSSDGDTSTERQGQNSNVQIDTDEKIRNEETKKETMGSDARSSDGDTLTERKGQNIKEENTTKDTKSKQAEKETMGSHDKSLEGDTLVERQIQNFNEEVTTEDIKSQQMEKDTMGSDDNYSEGHTLKERQGQNSKEKGIADSIKLDESEMETMGADDDNSSDGNTLTEKQGQALHLAKIAVEKIRKCNNTEARTDDVFHNVVLLMKLAKRFTVNPEMSILDLRPACSFLTEVFRKNECSLGHIKKLSDQQEECFKLLDDTSNNIWTEALRYEECLCGANSRFAKTNFEDPSGDLMDRLQNAFSEKEIVFFLSTLLSEVKKLISKTERKTAFQATAYVNLYCKIQILHSFVLWQVCCIMNRSAHHQQSTKEVLTMINSSQKTNLEMLKCITEPDVKNAVFLSVFNITENENVKHFLQIQNIETYLDKRFYEQMYELQWSRSPNVKLVMKTLAFRRDFGVYASTEHSNNFKFESVEGREFDNVCYIIVEPEKRHLYIGISSDGECKTHPSKNAHGVEWKLMSFGMDIFILASVDWPDMFLYLNPTTEKLKGTKNMEKVKSKGMWKVVSV
ncbi:uncharacterized protein LOC111105304 [Crassostrea virginica]